MDNEIASIIGQQSQPESVVGFCTNPGGRPQLTNNQLRQIALHLKKIEEDKAKQEMENRKIIY
uniref:Uncharacterized protein n=1 Tax=viral metagenome TaxID=1070528 RepID=A0A6M3IZ54_9ZZZZ